MTRYEYKKARRKWILQPVAGIFLFVVLMLLAGYIGAILAP